MKKHSLAAVLSLVGLGGLAVLGSSPEYFSRMVASLFSAELKTDISRRDFGSANAAQAENGSNLRKEAVVHEQNADIPDEVLWSFVFSLPERLEQQAELARLAGEDDSLWTDYFVRQAKLSATSSQMLREIAALYLADIIPIDERARSITQDIRAKDPQSPALQHDGSVAQRLVPTSLVDLQREKDAVSLRYRDRFRGAVGEEEFARFSEFLETEFKKGFVRKDEKGNDVPQHSDGANNGFKRFEANNAGGDR